MPRRHVELFHHSLRAWLRPWLWRGHHEIAWGTVYVVAWFGDPTSLGWLLQLRVATREHIISSGSAPHSEAAGGGRSSSERPSVSKKASGIFGLIYISSFERTWGAHESQACICCTFFRPCLGRELWKPSTHVPVERRSSVQNMKPKLLNWDVETAASPITTLSAGS